MVLVGIRKNFKYASAARNGATAGWRLATTVCRMRSGCWGAIPDSLSLCAGMSEVVRFALGCGHDLGLELSHWSVPLDNGLRENWMAVGGLEPTLS